MFNQFIIIIVASTFAFSNNFYSNEIPHLKSNEQINPITDSCFTATKKLTESNKEEDLMINEYLKDELLPIRKNYKRINSIEKWTSVVSKDIFESAEGGEVAFYYLDNLLEKIIVRNYGETYQNLIEYYFLEKEISFIIERTCRYNRPLYYDSLTMIAMNDTETFDLEKSIYNEKRSYFDNSKLIHQVNSEDCGAPFSETYLKEEDLRIRIDLANFLKK